MKKRTLEFTVGIFVLIGIGCVSYLTIKLGKLELFGNNKIHLSARFQSVSGLKNGANVELAGVSVGKVSSIKLDTEEMVALVELQLQKDIALSDDVIASIKTMGLIGDKYIKLNPGGSDIILKSGDIIIETEAPLDIEELVSNFVFGKM